MLRYGVVIQYNYYDVPYHFLASSQMQYKHLQER